MNQVMIVTGGSRGIGAATAKLAASRGYAVCLNYVSNKQAADEVVDAIAGSGGKAIAVAGDVASEADVLGMFEACDEAFGPLTCLVNNAGILDVGCRVDAMSAERMDRIFRTNITGSFLCAREAIKRMSTRNGGNGGTIVNLSSAAARLGGPGEYVDYAASKGAIDTMTIGLSKEVGDEGIRVNAIRPGLIYTDIHAVGGETGRVDRLAPNVPMKRGGTAEETAQAILWLASDDASYVNGALLDVAGGR